MLNPDYKKFARTMQTHTPWVAEVKPGLQRMLSEWTGRPFEEDFNGLRLFREAGRLYLDVGANRGQSITAIRLTAKSPRIVSFEANPMLAAKLNYRLGHAKDIEIHLVGLGETEGEFNLHIPRYRRYIFDGLASIDRDCAMSWLSSDTPFGFDPEKLTCEIVRCQVKTLDSFNLAPFFIKLDVQGYEFSALLGARETLKRHTPVLLIETPCKKLMDYLHSFGYRPYYFRKNRFYHGNDHGLNLFLMTDEKAELVAPFVQS